METIKSLIYNGGLPLLNGVLMFVYCYMTTSWLKELSARIRKLENER